MASIINATVTSPGGLVTTGDNTNELKIQTGETDAVTVNSSQVVAFNNPIVVAGNNISADNSLGFRNRIINGDMRIDQRNNGAAVTTSSSYPVDRFIISNTSDAAFSAQQDTSAPAGFVNSLKVTTTTADTSLTGTQVLIIQQRIEGTNTSDLAWGTASAKTVTLSFWVRSSLTGTFGGSLRNSAVDRSYPFTYTISAADTWEQKLVTIAGDTSGTWLTTSGIGVRVTFSLGSGPDVSGTAGAWAGTNYTSATGAVSVIGTLNATFYITGVQLEVGSVATPFERRPFGTELALCQRYFEKIGFGDSNSRYPTVGGYVNASSVSILQSVAFAVTKRAIPTITAGSAATFSCTASVDGPSVNGFRLIATSTTSGFISVNFTTDGITASIEL